MTPIGTKYIKPDTLLEQRSEGTYHQRYPWPDKDAVRVQNALLGQTSSMGQWVTGLVGLGAVVAGLFLLRGCA